MRIRLKRQLTMAAVLIVALVGSAAAQAINRELVIAQPTAFQWVDPQHTYLSTDAGMWQSIFDPLIFRMPDMSLAPGLATSWKQTGPKEWVLTLHKGVTFHDGEPFNAAVVKWNVERVIKPGFQDYAYLSPLSGAQVINDYTVKITTKDVYPTFPSLMSLFMMVPPTYFEKVGQAGFNKAPVGTGPYEFVSWNKGSSLTVKANPHYWNDVRAPTWNRVTWRIIPDSGARVSALFAGEVDVLKDLPTDDFARVNADPNLKAEWIRSLRTPYIGFFPKSPKEGAKPFNDVRVRQAVNYAVDMDSIIKALYNGMAFRTATLMTPDFPGYDPNVKPYPYDPAKAKQLLTEAGYPNGFKVAFETWSAGPAPQPVELAQAIASYLAKVGIDASVQPTDLASAFKDQLGKTLAPMFLWSWGGAQIVCDDKVWGVFDPASSASMMTTPEITSLIGQLQQTTEQSKRNQLCGQIQGLIHDNALILPLFAQADTYGVKSSLDWSPRPDEIILPWEVKQK